jgi:hypothetical protein
MLKVLKDRIYDGALYPVGQRAVEDKKNQDNQPCFSFYGRHLRFSPDMVIISLVGHQV